MPASRARAARCIRSGGRATGVTSRRDQPVPLFGVSVEAATNGDEHRASGDLTAEGQRRRRRPDRCGQPPGLRRDRLDAAWCADGRPRRSARPGSEIRREDALRIHAGRRDVAGRDHLVARKLAHRDAGGLKRLEPACRYAGHVRRHVDRIAPMPPCELDRNVGGIASADHEWRATRRERGTQFVQRADQERRPVRRSVQQPLVQDEQRKDPSGARGRREGGMIVDPQVSSEQNERAHAPG